VGAGGHGNERSYRADIQGLRALAVALVVAYHAGAPALGGGYIGVDVFFVISGYLITNLLWSELVRSRAISFTAFYARRARRLLPMAMLVLAFTMVASAALLPPLEVRSVWKDGIATALYWANYRFAALHTNYLSSAAPPSPFQQYWSLGVEEQFYLLWPLLLALVAEPVWRRVPFLRGPQRHQPRHVPPSRARALAALFALAGASFGLSYWLTGLDQPWAFFSLPTRAWELAAGGLVALASPALARVPRPVLAVTGWAGLGAIVAGALIFGPSTPFPGAAALVPVLGAAAVLVGGLVSCPWGAVALLGRRPLQLGGDISYSWYLWHWPLMALFPYLSGHALTLGEGLALAGASGALAYVSYVAVEQPARRSAWLTKRPWRSLGAGAALSASGVLTCVAATWALPAFEGHGVAPVAAAPAPLAPPKGRLSNPGEPKASQAAHQSPASPAGEDKNRSPSRLRAESPLAAAKARLRAQERVVAAAVQRSAATRYVPANLDLPLGQVSSSEAPPFLDGCMQGFTGTELLPCQFADVSSPTTAVLFGDSHAVMWFPALDRVAEAHHWRLVVWAKATCPPVDIALFSPDLGTPYTECEQWRSEVMARIAAMHPLLVVLGIAPNYDTAYDVTQDGPAWMAGLSRTIEALRRSGAHVLVMGPVESPNTLVPDCLSAHPDNVAFCNVPSKETHVGIGLVGYDNAGLAAEAKTVERAGGWFANVKSWFCAPSICPVIIGNIVVFRDNSHITVQYADYLEPLVATEVELALLQPEPHAGASAPS